MWIMVHTYLVLIIEVSDEAVGVVVLALVEGDKEREIIPVSILLVAHVIPNSVIKEYINAKKWLF